jgi:hypothetical protein
LTKNAGNVKISEIKGNEEEEYISFLLKRRGGWCKPCGKDMEGRFGACGLRERPVRAAALCFEPYPAAVWDMGT